MWLLMPEEKYEAIVRKILDAYNRQSLEEWITYFSGDVEVRWPDGAAPNIEGLREEFAEIIHILPDRKFDVHRLTSQGGTVVAELTVSGTHRGAEFMGVPPSGKSIKMSMAHVFDFREDKVKKWTVYANYQTMMDQLK